MKYFPLLCLLLAGCAEDSPFITAKGLDVINEVCSKHGGLKAVSVPYIDSHYTDWGYGLCNDGLWFKNWDIVGKELKAGIDRDRGDTH